MVSMGAVMTLLMCGGTVMGRRRPHRDVMTQGGRVRGYMTHPPYYSYLGVPYARPPNRQNRFKAPISALHWDGIFEATHQIKCPQPGGGEENCLVVNIFTAHNTSQPVLVHVHDGQFYSGWGSFQPPERLLQEGLVVVTFNYRLGAMGFLCLHTQEAPGNAGLKDALAAIKWIQSNIGKFGGNSNEITLYGTGAGAIIAELLLISGQTKNIIHKMILESGSALSPLALTYDPFKDGLEAAKLLDFKGTKNLRKSLTNFYVELPTRQLVNMSFIFTPCIESDHLADSLLSKDPLLNLQKHDLDPMPMIYVYSTSEKVLLNKDKQITEIPNNFHELLPNNLDMDEQTKIKIADLVKTSYYENNMNGESYDILLSYLNDILFIYPIVKSAVLHDAGGSQVFLMELLNCKNIEQEYYINNYLFSRKVDKYSNDVLGWPILIMWRNFIRYGTNWVLQSDHFISTNSKFNNQVSIYLNHPQRWYFLNSEFGPGYRLQTSSSIKTPLDFIAEELWPNFRPYIVLFSDPTPLTTSFITTIWQPVSSGINTVSVENAQYLQYGENTLRIRSSSHHQLALWDTIYNKFYKPHVNMCEH